MANYIIDASLSIKNLENSKMVNKDYQIKIRCYGKTFIKEVYVI